MVFRCYIDSHQTLSEDFLITIFQKQRLFAEYKICKVEAGWGSKQWLVYTDVGRCLAIDFDRDYLGNNLYNVDLTVSRVRQTYFDFSGETEIEKKSGEW